MQVATNWNPALEAARLGDLAPAREARGAGEQGPLDDYFWGRCLAEAGAELDEAIACLTQAKNQLRGNVLVNHVLALAKLRAPRAELKAEARRQLAKAGLPHDLDLLAQYAFSIESELRPMPTTPGTEGLAWPDGLPNPEADPDVSVDPELGGAVDGGEEQGGAEAEEGVAAGGERDNVSEPPAELVSKRPGWWRRRKLLRVAESLEEPLMSCRQREVLEQTNRLLGEGLEGPELHLLAGIAAEELGDAGRARAHLLRSAALEPTMMLSRTALGKVYWRLNWNDLARDVWLSLPVEGPFDHGRHYHLALAHYGAGDLRGAFEAMRLALGDFFFETRHFYIKRVFERWLAETGPVAAANPESSQKA